uniref:Uncharacterized protein n=1 Tax=Aegilops tauschii subsp. strangulata TaxID=200361 RepID=A0A453RDA9_AEGTS
FEYTCILTPIFVLWPCRLRSRNLHPKSTITCSKCCQSCYSRETKPGTGF